MDGWCITVVSALPAVWLFDVDECELHLSDADGRPAALISDGSGIQSGGQYYDMVCPRELARRAIMRERYWQLLFESFLNGFGLTFEIVLGFLWFSYGVCKEVPFRSKAKEMLMQRQGSFDPQKMQDCRKLFPNSC